MRRLHCVLLLLAPLLAACPAPDPGALAARHPWALAREHGRFLQVDGSRVFALTRGSGRDVVLLHGNPASMRTWKHVVEPLAAHYRVHAVDLPGFGMSDKPDAPYDEPWLARQVAAYLDGVGVATAALVGNSMGGAAASETAIRYPARVEALVLLGASGLPEPDDAGERVEEGGGLLLWLLRWPGMEAVVRALPVRGVLRRRLAPAYYDPGQLTDAELEEWLLPLQTAGGMKAYLARSGREADPAREERVRSIRAPTLVIHGDTDRLVPLAVGRRYHELIPGSELVVLEQTGHLPQEERPQRVVAEIRRWLDAHP